MNQIDCTRLDQLYHDRVLFDEMVEMMRRFEELNPPPIKKNYGINSELPTEVLSDYFANAKFSRG